MTTSGESGRPTKIVNCAGRAAAAHVRTPMIGGVCPVCGEAQSFLSRRISNRPTDDGYGTNIPPKKARWRHRLAFWWCWQVSRKQPCRSVDGVQCQRCLVRFASTGGADIAEAQRARAE